jgi:hypothetical protein
MDVQKKAMLQALEKALGIVTQACKVVGISRQTHYNWMNSDEDYKTAVEDLGDVALDFAESKLHKLIDSGNPAATIFYLKTKGKNRGYVERQEIAVAEKKPLSWFTDDNADVS